MENPDRRSRPQQRFLQQIKGETVGPACRLEQRTDGGQGTQIDRAIGQGAGGTGGERLQSGVVGHPGQKTRSQWPQILAQSLAPGQIAVAGLQIVAGDHPEIALPRRKKVFQITPGENRLPILGEHRGLRRNIARGTLRKSPQIFGQVLRWHRFCRIGNPVRRWGRLATGRYQQSQKNNARPPSFSPHRHHYLSSRYFRTFRNKCPEYCQNHVIKSTGIFWKKTGICV